MEDTTEFAFGENEVQGKSCPMVTSGLSGQELTTVAEEYDKIVRQRYGLREGTLPKSVAESCWNEAIDSVRYTMLTTKKSEYKIHLSVAIDRAEKVADIVF